MFPNSNGIKRGISNRKITRKSPSTWRSKTLPNNP
jgi:hypothetical protein